MLRKYFLILVVAGLLVMASSLEAQHVNPGIGTTSSPEPRTVTDQMMIVEDWDYGAGDGDMTFPQGPGIDLNGARSAYFTLEFSSFSAGVLGVELKIGPTGFADPDTLYTVCDNAGDPIRWLFDSADHPTAGAVTEPITVFEGAPMGGTLYLKLYNAGSLAIANVDAAVVVIW